MSMTDVLNCSESVSIKYWLARNEIEFDNFLLYSGTPKYLDCSLITEYANDSNSWDWVSVL